MTKLSFLHDCLLLDACCAINLYLSGHMSSILSALPVPVAISEYVFSVEAAGNVRSTGKSGALSVETKGEAIQLQPLREAGLLQVVELTEKEEVDAVNFAALIDPGEAFTCAIALNRGWAIATDDKKAISFFEDEVPQLQLVSTPQLIKYWADSTAPSEEQLREILQSVQRLGRYQPPKEDLLSKWWVAHT